jgi:hypothetical protein
MASTPLKNLKVFKKLCGDESLYRVIFATTMWDKVAGELDIAEARLRELKGDYWKHFIDKGSRVDCSHGTAKDAWSIVWRLVNETDKRECILLQKELVDLRRKLNEAKAGKAVRASLGANLEAKHDDVTELLESIKDAPNNSELQKDLRVELVQKQGEIQELMRDLQELKIPLSRRFMLLFFRNETVAVSLTLPLSSIFFT